MSRSKSGHSNLTRSQLWAARLDRLPRLERIILSLLITLLLVILVSFIIDRVLIDNVVEGDMDPMLPALIAVVLGLLFYGIGWWAMVGFDMNGPWHAGKPAVIYAALGALALVMLAVLAIFGLLFGYVL